VQQHPVSRRRARERAVQYLFALDFTKYDWREELETFWEMNPSKPGVQRYAERVIAGVCERQEELDPLIGAALENWTLDRIGAVERALLRLALYEMLYCADVPASVAINEAIEVGKVYGSSETPRFLNGVLDRLRKQLTNIDAKKIVPANNADEDDEGDTEPED